MARRVRLVHKKVLGSTAPTKPKPKPASAPSRPANPAKPVKPAKPKGKALPRVLYRKITLVKFPRSRSKPTLSGDVFGYPF